MPLSGLRVIDLTRILAGPFCTMLLGDMGAEVIKIETPGEGDPVRRQGVIRDGLSWYFAGFNRNKRSLTLNLRHEEGREVLAKLIAGGDVLVENFRPGVLDRIGFDKARLDVLNPDLVCCHITGFGDSGPYRDRPSFDFIAQAMSGFMSVTGEPAPARRSADWRLGGRALCRAWGVRGAGAARANRAWRHRWVQPQQCHDQHAGVSRRELPCDRRAARAHRQRPCDRLALRDVSHRRRRGGDRTVERSGLLSADRGNRRARVAGPPGFSEQ